MGSMSIWHWVIVAIVVMLLFGKGRISEMMGDLAKGINAFKKGLSDDEAAGRNAPPPAQITQQPERPTETGAPTSSRDQVSR